MTANIDTDNQILVDFGNQDSDTGEPVCQCVCVCVIALCYNDFHLSPSFPHPSGLLVDVNAGHSPPSSPPVEPAVGRIISIDTLWNTEDDDREDTALVPSAQPKSDDDVMSSPSRQKPARPAPPKPAIRRAKTVKEKPDLPPRPSERSEFGSSSPPAGQSSDAQSLIIIDSRQKSKSVR